MNKDKLNRLAYSVGAMRLLAQRTLPRAIFEHADGGAGDEITVRRSEAAFAELELLPRPMTPIGPRDLSVELFGKRLSLPVIIGPTGLQGLFWPDGEIANARAAAAAGTAYCLSHGSICTLEQLAAGAGHPRWMQIYIYRDRSFTRELIDRAAAAGYDALVLTVDNQLTGVRERDIRNGFTIPPRLGPAQLADMATKLPWLWRMRSHLQRITFGNYARPGESASAVNIARRLGGMLDSAMTWADIDMVRSLWKGPLILKGILHPEEAKAALEHGVDAIVVSSHGGRQLDGVPATIDALPSVADAVAGRMPLLLDSGVRRGSDVVKAIALGATACLIGRPHVWGLATAGEAGVARVLEIFGQEIDQTMGLCGITRISEIGPDLIFSRSRR